MNRELFTLTEKQLKKCNQNPAVPSDEEFKARWARAHYGKTAGWGMGKRDWFISIMTQTPEYQRGIWQGRVDRARGMEYCEERSDAPYNLGYYRGYTEYESNRHGWDRATRERFDAEYVND